MRRGRARRHAPAVVSVPQVCGSCGERFGTAILLAAHAETCWRAPVVETDPVRLLSLATLDLIAKVPVTDPSAAGVIYAIQRTAHGMDPEQRRRLAWMVQQLADLIPTAAS